MHYFKLAMVQHRTLTPDVAENTACAIDFIRQAKAQGADFVLFPECFLTSYVAPTICRALKPVAEIENNPEFINWCERALTSSDRHLDMIRAAAKELHVGVCITAFTKGKKYPQNSAFVIDRSGEIVLQYSKVHTCDFDWERYLEGGTEFSVCDFDGICLGVMICYDREYPESGRELMLQGAEVVLVPNDCDAMPPRLKELSVQAMQNMSGVAMANPPGADEGNSCAYHPLVWDDEGKAADNTVVVAPCAYDGLVYATFDLQAIRDYRAAEDLGKYRKPSAYRHLA